MTDEEIKIEWLNKNTLLIAIPEPDGYFHPIIIHVSERKWYCSEEKAKEHVRGAWRAFQKFVKKYKLIYKTYTVVCIANYTRNVRGRGVYRLGLRKWKGGVFIFRPDKPWLTVLVRSLYNMFRSRLNNLAQKLDEARVEAFGIVKELKDWLKEVVRLFQLKFSDLLMLR